MNPCPVLVGRQQELSSLRALLDAGGGVAIVSGEAGIGKSRLIREFASEAQKVGRVVLWGRPEEVAQPGPYALIVDLLESIVERCGAGVKNDVRVLTGDLLRSADDERPAPTPRSVAAETRGLLAQLGDPPLVLLEDLHWGDEASHSVVLHLARAAADDGHIIIGTLRPEAASASESLVRLIDTLSRDRIASMISLEPLADNETATMLELMWGRPPVGSELAALRSFGEGVPFFIEELAGSGPPDGAFRVPKTIEQSVAARLRGMGAEGERVLNAASLLAGQVDAAVLAVACDLSEARVAEILVAAADAGLLADQENRLMFRHGLVRQAIADSVVSLEAMQIHGRLARAIEQVHAKELDPLSSALAHHYSNAGDRDAAVPWAVGAGERAIALAALDEARNSFRLAVDMSGRKSVAALNGLAETELRDGNQAEAAELFRASASEQQQLGDSAGAARTLGRLAWAMLGRADSAHVLRVLEEALALLSPMANAEEYSRLMLQRGSFLCFVFNQAVESQPVLEEALAVARRVADPALIAEALDGLAQAADLEGRLQDALVLGSDAIAAATKAGTAESIGRTHNNYAVRLATLGRPVEALEVVARGREHLVKNHGPAAVGALDVTRAWILWLMGAPTEVAHLTARGKAAWDRWRGYRWLLEVWAAIERGENGVGQAVVAETVEELGDIRAALMRGELSSIDAEAIQAILAQALLSLNQGRAADALQSTSSLVSAAPDVVEPLDFGQILVAHVRTLVALGKLDEASDSLRSLSKLVESHPYPYLVASLLEAQATWRLAQQDEAAALPILNRAVAAFSEISNSSDRARCQRLAAEIMMKSAEAQGEAIVLLKEARGLAESSGSVVERNRIESDLRSLGIRPRAGRPRREAGSGDGPLLSPREAEIAVLVATGETNTDIGRRLFLSERTVQDHVTHALKKLGLSGRAALASWAVKNGMI